MPSPGAIPATAAGLPYTPGNDAAGVVEAVGVGVRGVVPGDRVYTSGTTTGAYAELALSEANCVHPLPPGASFAQGAALGVPYATAWRALFQRARAVPGEAVLVHGASGGVGISALQIARAAGLRITGTAGTTEGIGLIAREGAHHAFDHRFPGNLENAVGLTGGRGFDVILEMLSNVNRIVLGYAPSNENVVYILAATPGQDIRRPMPGAAHSRT